MCMWATICGCLEALEDHLTPGGHRGQCHCLEQGPVVGPLEETFQMLEMVTSLSRELSVNSHALGNWQKEQWPQRGRRCLRPDVEGTWPLAPALCHKECGPRFFFQSDKEYLWSPEDDGNAASLVPQIVLEGLEALKPPCSLGLFEAFPPRLNPRSQGEFHRQRSLMGYSLWGHKESDTINTLTFFHFLIMSSDKINDKNMFWWVNGGL